jgi:diadenosine tetraphosphatase ApaH/serine/threonine PP2A family protein phosphatase
VKLALLADIHANLEALEACLEHAREQGAEGLAFLGDLVGYGADPAAVLERVRALAVAGAVAVRGNHDAAVGAAGTDTMNRAAEAAVDWTRQQLDGSQLAFLAALPLTVRQGPICFVHASADRPADWTYIQDARGAAQSVAAAHATWVFSGHVHEQALYHLTPAGHALPFKPVPGVAIPVPARRRWLAVVGSVGQPRDGNTAACYALFDTERTTLTFHRVPYDWSVAATKIRAAGLPEFLALRLERGE